MADRIDGTTKKTNQPKKQKNGSYENLDERPAPHGRGGSGRDRYQHKNGPGAEAGARCGKQQVGAYSALRDKGRNQMPQQFSYQGQPQQFLQQQFVAQYQQQQQFQQQYMPHQQRYVHPQQAGPYNPRSPMTPEQIVQQDQQRQIQEYMQQRQQQIGPQHRQQDRRIRQAQDGGGGNNDNRQGKQWKKPGDKKIFAAYWDAEQLQRGLKRGELIQGPIRINPRNYQDAYIPHPDGVSDIYISGIPDRNRALNGDIVAVVLFPREQWKVLVDDMNNQSAVLEAKFKNLRLNNPAAGSSDTPAETEDTKNEVPAAIGAGMGEKATGPDVVIEEEVTDDESASDSEEKSHRSGKVCDTTASGGQSTAQENAAQSTVAQNPPPAKKNGHKDGGGGKVKNENNANNAQQLKSNGKGKNTATKKFTTLGDLGSPEYRGDGTVKKLFQQQGKNEAEQTQHRKLKMDAVPDKLLLRTGKVVAIIEKKHSRACTGYLRPMPDRNPHVALFSPMDHRVPRIHVARADWPEGFAERPADFAKTLFVARISRWEECYMNAHGTLAKSLGEAGEIEPETEGILISNDIDFEEFKDDAIQCLPPVSPENPWRIPESEFAYRKDLRKECIFTIDPATARDLDDALHVNYLGDDVYEVGVHIADVSFFVDPGNALDKVAASRATSVYLVQKVVPMLPRLLCEQLCSLNPDEDRLTFSVIWKMKENGEILDEWFGRSVIRSCVKLSYEHAQGFIEHPDRTWTPDQIPPISDGFTLEHIRERVLNLDKIAKHLRRHRFDSGALRLDQVKLSYTLDKASGMPNGFYVFKAKDSNKLVEEFMLLANMAVAHRIYKAYPDLATLRRHPEPQSKQLDDLVATCSSLGIELDASSAGTLQRSMARLAGPGLDDVARVQILTVLCSKPMQNAKYFCTGCLPEEHMYRHYALNVPLYTHFTSPIRRYPDIMVHRLLGASLDYNEAPKLEKTEVMRECEICNDKKLAAKTASDLSSELFFAVFVKECGPMEEAGMVMAVLDRSFDVLVLKLGVVKRVYCEQLPLETHSFRLDGKRPELTMTWASSDLHPREVVQTVTIFTHVNVVLQASTDEPLKLSATTKHPDEAVASEDGGSQAPAASEEDGEVTQGQD